MADIDIWDDELVYVSVGSDQGTTRALSKLHPFERDNGDFSRSDIPKPEPNRPCTWFVL